MSFIKENIFLEAELIRIAQNKPQPDQYMNSIVLQGLLSKLDTDLSTPVHVQGSELFRSGTKGAELFFDDLSTADNLLSFLDKNKVTFNNAPLVLGHISTGFSAGTSVGDISYQQLRAEDKNKYFKYPAPTDTAKNDFSYYVNRDGIIVFLKLQLDKAKQNPSGELYTTVISKLIQEISSLSGEKIDLAPPKYEDDKYGLGRKTDEMNPNTSKSAPGSSTTTTQSKQNYYNQIATLVGMLPLRPDRLDFEAIRQFVNKLVILMPEISSNVALIDASINEANALSTDKNLMILTDGGADDLKHSMIDQQQSTYCKYMICANNILRNVKMTIFKFKAKFGDELAANLDKDNLPILRQNPTWYQAVLSQIGAHENDSYGLANRNKIILDSYNHSGGCFVPK